jgi:hypothetical protein
MDFQRDDNRGQRNNWFHEEDCRLSDFVDALTKGPVTSLEYAVSATSGIPAYECGDLEAVLSSEKTRRKLLSEWARVLDDGAGVFVLRGAYSNTRVVDEATAVFEAIIAAERRSGSKGDHFAKAGANDRIWNAQEKLLLASPGVFTDYFSNPWLPAAAEAWLGPCFQVTSQVNVVISGARAPYVALPHAAGRSGAW